jgi:hypothetical protein
MPDDASGAKVARKQETKTGKQTEMHAAGNDTGDPGGGPLPGVDRPCPPDVTPYQASGGAAYREGESGDAGSGPPPGTDRGYPPGEAGYQAAGGASRHRDVENGDGGSGPKPGFDRPLPPGTGGRKPAPAIKPPSRSGR